MSGAPRLLLVLDLGDSDPQDSLTVALAPLTAGTVANNLLRSEVTRLAQPDGTYDRCACGAATGTQDEEYDSGESMFRRWCWTTIVSDGRQVWHLCETCSAGLDAPGMSAEARALFDGALATQKGLTP